MPLFNCTNCGCVENTALCRFWINHQRGHVHAAGGPVVTASTTKAIFPLMASSNCPDATQIESRAICEAGKTTHLCGFSIRANATGARDPQRDRDRHDLGSAINKAIEEYGVPENQRGRLIARRWDRATRRARTKIEFSFLNGNLAAPAGKRSVGRCRPTNLEIQQ